MWWLWGTISSLLTTVQRVHSEQNFLACK